METGPIWPLLLPTNVCLMWDSKSCAFIMSDRATNTPADSESTFNSLSEWTPLAFSVSCSTVQDLFHYVVLTLTSHSLYRLFLLTSPRTHPKSTPPITLKTPNIPLPRPLNLSFLFIYFYYSFYVISIEWFEKKYFNSSCKKIIRTWILFCKYLEEISNLLSWYLIMFCVCISVYPFSII